MIKDIDKYFPGSEFPEHFEHTFDLLGFEINENAIQKGFWDSMDSVLGKMEAYKKVNDKGSVSEPVFTQKEIQQVKKAFIAQKIMLIVSELGEAIESDRVSHYADWDEFDRLYKDFRRQNHSNETCFVWAFEGAIKDTFEDEIADTIVRELDLVKKVDIDILKHIIFKMVYNSTRDKLHNKEY